VHCTKISTEFKVWGHSPPRGHSPKNVVLQRWENHHRLSSSLYNHFSQMFRLLLYLVLSSNLKSVLTNQIRQTATFAVFLCAQCLINNQSVTGTRCCQKWQSDKSVSLATCISDVRYDRPLVSALTSSEYYTHLSPMT